MKLIMQKYGDRGGNVGSIRDYAHTIPANPMSDRGQMAIEIYVCDKQPKEIQGRGAVEGGGHCPDHQRNRL